MPASAYALLGLFTAISAASGVLAAWVVGPRRWWAAVAPFLATFGALYLVGHRLGLSLGPEVTVFGFRVSLAFDVAVAIATAFVTAALQAGVVSLLQPKERRAGRDGHA